MPIALIATIGGALVVEGAVAAGASAIAASIIAPLRHDTPTCAVSRRE